MRDFKPKNSQRAELAEIFNMHFFLFYLMHEIGHLNQNSVQLEALINSLSNEEEKNIIHQIKEMDADLFAVNGFLRHAYNTFNDKQNVYNQKYPFFYQNEFNLVRYSLIIIQAIFYLHTNKTNQQINILGKKYPHYSLRMNYISRQILNNSVLNELLGINNYQDCSNKSLNDFNYIIKKIFSENNLLEFYESDKKEELLEHYEFLRKEAVKYNGLLNGFYE